jgi:phosphate transport system substrate-binding protein
VTPRRSPWSFQASLAQARAVGNALAECCGQCHTVAVEAAAAALWPRTPPDERLTLVNAPGANAYPLINYEYAVVSKKQPSPETAAALRSFLLWAIAPDETNAQYLADAHFIPLPAHVWVLSYDQIEEIK